MNNKLLHKTGIDTAAAINRAIVLSVLKECSPISRKEIAAITNLQTSTITYIVKELMEMKLIEQCGKGDSNHRGGRRPIFLQLRKDIGYVAGIEIGIDKIRLCRIDINGSIIDFKENQIQNKNMDSILQYIIDYCSEWNDMKLLGIGIGFPAIIR